MAFSQRKPWGYEKMIPVSTSGEGIYSRLANDPDLRDIVEMFVDEMPERIAALVGYLESGEMEELRRAAHQLKGAAGSYGFEPISPCAGRLECAIRDGETVERIRETVAELAELCSRIRCDRPA
jgi:HPt (histidine-containing phosphotransfer) domain-containing protein